TFCCNPSQRALTALAYCWTASLLLDADRWTGPGSAGCRLDEQAATRRQALAAMAIAPLCPMSHLIDPGEPVCAFVAITLRHRRFPEMVQPAVLPALSEPPPSAVPAHGHGYVGSPRGSLEAHRPGLRRSRAGDAVQGIGSGS